MSMKRINSSPVTYIVIYIAIVTMLTACTTTETVQHQQTSLYQRLGGQTAIAAVVDDFVKNVATDQRINEFFADADIEEFKSLLSEQICEASGGPCRYSGRSMRAAHAGLGITDEHFSALAQDLQKSLDTFKVPAQEQNELLTLLAGMKGDIVR